MVAKTLSTPASLADVLESLAAQVAIEACDVHVLGDAAGPSRPRTTSVKVRCVTGDENVQPAIVVVIEGPAREARLGPVMPMASVTSVKVPSRLLWNSCGVRLQVR